MTLETKKLFLEDAYQAEAPATVLAINERGGIMLDESIFYATSGGQPGDRGTLSLPSGERVAIAATVCGQDKNEIILVPESQEKMPIIGDKVASRIDWARRYRLMRMHTALHLLCACVPFPVTGGQIGEEESRLDFDMPENADKQALTGRLNELVEENHPVTSRWVSDAQLEENPELIRTMSVKPPMGTGQVRLIAIGEGGAVDLQPCGGTHVRSTAEIGALEVYKIEKKGKQNRRIRVRLTEEKIA